LVGAEVVVGGAAEEGGLTKLVGTLAPVLPIGWGAGTPALALCGATRAGAAGSLGPPLGGFGSLPFPAFGTGEGGTEVADAGDPTVGATRALPVVRKGTNSAAPARTRAASAAAATRVLRREPISRHRDLADSTSNGVLVNAGRCGIVAGAG
jgi:hypothetical protein